VIRLRRWLPLLLAFFSTAATAAESPRLVVVISVDQLRFDYVDRFSPWLTERGFKRFAREGAVFPNARYRYSVTFTGPGHTAIGTGLTPAESGIVGNTWFERDTPLDEAQWQWYFDDNTVYVAPGLKARNETSATPWWKLGGTPRYCAYDGRVKVSAGKSSGMSPANLSGDALGDRVKERHPQSRVFALALKDRAAILMAGRRADAAYWFDRDLPGFVSSTYYRFNPDVLAFNDSLRGYMPGSDEWRPSPFIPVQDLPRVTFDPPAAWPLKNNTYGGTFPHPVKSAKAFTYTPFAQDMILDFAHHLIVTEKLGTRDTPDVLFVGVTPTDYVGHYYGPDSLEVADNFVRLDRSLAHFLDLLERRFGNRVLVALTGDHGVQSNPEIVKLRDPNADVGRLDLRTPSPNATLIADLPPLRIHIERDLARRLGIPFSASAPLSQSLVYFFEEPSLWLNWKRVSELRLDGERVKRTLRDVVRDMKQHGIDDAWTNTEMLAADANASRIQQLMRASYRSDRAGDVLMALRPGWIWMWGSNSTTHGQPVDNDMHVPLMFWGAGVKPGVYDVEASPLDLARTLGGVLDVEAGGRTSRALPCF
jgi:predicted AlkP superfamily pyrophosphatase or phosphodiesterase